jgi:phosphoribosylglycinamide formyltransferase-1
MEKLAVFASGNGSNAQRIAEYFEKSNKTQISLIASNNKNAYVLERARNLKIPSFVFHRNDLYNSDKVLKKLIHFDIDWIILAGFLWLIPVTILAKYNKRIINIHPALLPKYGGKGMYGDKVHKAVIENQEEVSGITIHYVNDRYDEGQIIYQARCKVETDDTPETLAKKIHQLEYKHYPEIIERLVLKDDMND